MAKWSTGSQRLPGANDGRDGDMLLHTLLTDTGGFSYGAVKASTFEMAREMVAAGANPVRIAQDIYVLCAHVEDAAAGRGT